MISAFMFSDKAHKWDYFNNPDPFDTQYLCSPLKDEKIGKMAVSQENVLVDSPSKSGQRNGSTFDEQTVSLSRDKAKLQHQLLKRCRRKVIHVFDEVRFDKPTLPLFEFDQMRRHAIHVENGPLFGSCCDRRHDLPQINHVLNITIKSKRSCGYT